jgi:hypothetical protein
MQVTDTFTITEFDSLVQADFTVTFEQDGVSKTPTYTITNEGSGEYQIVFEPETTGSWWLRVVYVTYKFEQTYEVGPIEPDEDIVIERQPRQTNDDGDFVWADNIVLVRNTTHRVNLPRTIGPDYSVSVTPVESRGVDVQVKRAQRYFDMKALFFDTLAGNRQSVMVTYTVHVWGELEKELKRLRNELRRVQHAERTAVRT